MHIQGQIVASNKSFDLNLNDEFNGKLDWLGDQTYHLYLNNKKYIFEIKRFIFASSGIEVEGWAGDLDSNMYGKIAIKFLPLPS